MMRLQAALRCLAIAAVCFFIPQPSLAKEEGFNVGYRSLVTWIASENVRLDVSVWYPARRAPSKLNLGEWSFSAARNAAPLSGAWPVILLSHDSTGSRYAHYTLALMLAQRGYIVLAPQHDGDNLDDMRLLYTVSSLTNRSRQLSVALDMLLGDETLSAVCDVQNIGIVGFGNGGTAALLTAGAKLDSKEWERYVANNTDSQHAAKSDEASKKNKDEMLPVASTSNGNEKHTVSDPYLCPSNSKHIDTIIKSMIDETLFQKESVSLHSQALAAREHAQKRFDDSMRKNKTWLLKVQKKSQPVFPDVPFLLPYFPGLAPASNFEDMRFSHILLVSPGYFPLFDKNSLQNLHSKVMLIGLENDFLNIPEFQAKKFLKNIGPQEAGYTFFSEADVPAMQAPCPPTIDIPDLCNTVSPEQRETLTRNLYSEILKFLPPPQLPQ